jgi:hypothetical protein
VSVQPYTSPEAPSQNTSGAGSSGGASIPTNSSVPDLAMVWATAPSFTAAAADSSSNPPSVPVAADLSIDLGSLLDGENAMLSASSVIVGAYESLKQQFESVKDTVFGQQAQDTVQTETSATSGFTVWSTTTSPDPIQQPAQDFANGQNGQPGMNDAQAFALQQIGNAMALVGEFIALMNSAGDNYATADSNSAVPSASGS